MKTTLGRIAGLCCMGVLSFGSTIDNISFSDGTIRTVFMNTFDAYGSNMGPMVITANFGSGSASCSWSGATAGCSVANQFQIGFSPGYGHTYPTLTPDGFWYIDNLRSPLAGSTNNIFSITIDTLAGNIALDRCMAGSVFNDNNKDLNANCIGEGTLGSSNGWTANDAPGGNNIVADVAYTTRLRTATQNVGDLYGFMTLTFNRGETTFDPGERFTWYMDTDQITLAPEPATLGLVGGVLLALGLVRRKKRE